MGLLDGVFTGAGVHRRETAARVLWWAGAVREEADTPPAPSPATPPRTDPASASQRASGGNPPSGDMLGPMSEDEHQELAAAVEAAR